MEDSKPQMHLEDSSVTYMFQVCLLAFMRSADQPTFHESISLFDSLARYAAAQDPSLNSRYDYLLLNYMMGDKALPELQCDVATLLATAPSSPAAPSAPLRAHFAPFLAMPLRTPRQRRAAGHLFAVLTGLPQSPHAHSPPAAARAGGERARRPLGVLY